MTLEGRKSFLERYEHFAMPEPNTGCFIWTGSLSWNGYGQVGTGYKNQKARKLGLAHREAYEYFVGPIPEGMDLDHKCRMRCCVNPDHLEPVTRSENSRRGIGPGLAKIRQESKTHCKRGHPLIGENLRIDSKTGGRLCRACISRISREYRNLRKRMS